MAASPALTRWPPDSRARGDLQEGGVEADVGQDPRGAAVVVVAAEGQEAGQGVVVGLQLPPARVVADGPQGGLHGPLGHGQPGAAAQVGGGRLAGQGVGLLGQVADVEAGGRALHRPGGRGLQPGQAAQQGRLAGAVAAQHPDAAGPVDDQVDRVEHDLGAADHREVPGGEHAPAWHGRGPRDPRGSGGPDDQGAGAAEQGGEPVRPGPESAAGAGSGGASASWRSATRGPVGSGPGGAAGS